MIVFFNLSADKPKQNEDVRKSVNKTYTYYMQNLNKQIEENKSLRAENDADVYKRQEEALELIGYSPDKRGKVFARVLEDAGVYKCTPEGRAAFETFIASVK